MELTSIDGKFKVYEICDITTHNVVEYEIVIISVGDSSRCLISKEKDTQLFMKLKDVLASIGIETAKSVKAVMIKDNPELTEDQIDDILKEMMKSAK